KGELGTRWPMIELLDILKETDLRVRFTDRFHTQTLRENLDRAMIQKRLLLGLYGLGTNIGLKRVCAGDQSESYRDVLYICRRRDHRAVALRLRKAGRAQLCRYPRTIGNRVCFLFLVGLSALAPPEESACPKAVSS